MSKTNCNIIKDLIPLCVDKIASQESAEIVEEHLKTCKECDSEFDKLSTTIEIIEDHDSSLIKKIKKIIFRKKVIVSTIVSILVAAFLLGAFCFITAYEFEMSYSDVSKNLFIEGDSDGTFKVGVEGIDYYSFKSAECNVVFDDEYKLKNKEEKFYLTYTIWTKYFSNKKERIVLYEFENDGYMNQTTPIIVNADEKGIITDGSNEYKYEEYKVYLYILNYQVFEYDYNGGLTFDDMLIEIGESNIIW